MSSKLMPESPAPGEIVEGVDCPEEPLVKPGVIKPELADKDVCEDR